MAKCEFKEKNRNELLKNEFVKDLKDLLVRTKDEFEDLQSQFQRDLKYLGILTIGC